MDDVHKDVETRLLNAVDVGLSQTSKYLRNISSKLNIDHNKGIPILVFNPYEYKRDAVISIDLNLPFEEFYITDEKEKKCDFFVEDVSYKNYFDKFDFEKNIAAASYLSSFQVFPSPAALISKNFKTLTFKSELEPLNFKIFYIKKGLQILSKIQIFKMSILKMNFTNFI